MTNAYIQEDFEIIALLCVGEVAQYNNEAITPLTPLFGQPMVHHFIKGLEKLGISKFYIGVDTVPGALLAYRDAASKDGIDVQFVRDPASVAKDMNQRTRALIVRADTLHAPAFVHQLLSKNQPLIAAVEERAENQIFERIDLNNRWAGVALLERHTLMALSHMPEGWDMASALLRQAVQDAVALSPVRQADIQNGNIRKLVTMEDLAAAHAVVSGGPFGRTVTFESKLIAYPLEKFLPAVWSVPWGRALSHWLFPVFASLSCFLALSNFALASALIAIIAIFSAVMRNAIRVVEYQTGQSDWIGSACWLVMAIALAALLNLSEPKVFDAVFLALSVTGLAILHAMSSDKDSYGFLSPMGIAACVVLGAFIDATGLVIKLLILLEIGRLLVRLFRQNQTTKAVD